MRALSLRGPRSISQVEVDAPVPSQGQVVVRVRACGVCASDLNAWRGVEGIEYPLAPGAPGHETWGEVAALGPGASRFAQGDIVTGLAWNGFAELTVAEAANLVAVPRQLDGYPLLGEPLACAMNVVRRSGVQPGDGVAIVGFGYLAALIVQLLPSDVSWIAVSRREDSRECALRLGAQAVYDFSSVPPNCWDSFRITIEAAGVQQTLDYATWLTAFGGRLVIAGYHADGVRTVNMQSWNWKGIDVINAHEREPSVYVSALRDALQHQVEFKDLHTHRFRLEDAEEAFRMAETRPPGFVKALVCP